MIEEKKSKDYDVEPIVISNNFTTIVLGIVFWMLVNLFVIYAFFYSGTINWTNHQSWIITLQEQMEASTRFGTILIAMFSSNIMALIAFRRKLREPVKLCFNGQSIESSKSFNNLEKINLVDISKIEKGMYPLLVTGYEKENIISMIATTIGSLFLLIGIVFIWICEVLVWTYYFLILKEQPNISKYPYITIFVKGTHRVVNIHLISRKEYLELEKYFLKKCKINIQNIDINMEISNTKKEGLNVR